MPGTFASPFASSSLWNTPIDPLDSIYSNPVSIQNQQFYDTGLANTWASVENIEYDTPANAPIVTWTYNLLNQSQVGGTFQADGTIQLQTPTNIVFGNGSDGWAIFNDPDGVHYWEVWEGSYNAQTMTYSAAYMVEGNYVTGTGWGQNGAGAGIRASGASLLGGIVTQAELNNLSIPHALSIELAPTQLEAGATQSDQFVSPAVSADSDSVGLYSGTIPMGAHFALPPGLDLADAGLTPEGLALAEAYQTYGGYVVDSATDTTSLAQIEGGTTRQISDIDADLTWIRDHLVMTATMSQVGTAIESFGSTSLVQSGANFYLDSTSSGSGPELKYAGAAVVAGQFGGWTAIGVEQTASGYDVAWKMPGANQYSVWATDSAGNFTSLLIGPVSGNSLALESFETTFEQDLNGDGVIGVPAHTEASVSTSVIQSGTNFYLESISNGSGPELIYGGAPVSVGEFGAWSPIGTVQTASGYDVAWKIPGSDQYSVWATDTGGNFTSLLIGPVAGNSTGLESFETTFQQDLNGDGVIGVPGTVIETSGSTSLVQNGSNFYLDSISSGSGPQLKDNGVAVVAGQFGGWTPIGVEQTASGYDVAWKMANADQYSVWSTDSNGNAISVLIGPVSGKSAALESFETTFQQDLNGDGHIGLIVGAGAVLELPAAQSGLVTFATSTGTLKLDTPSTFTGQIAGFTGNGTLSGSDQIDLVNLNYNSSIQTSTSYNSSTGVLSVGNGSTVDLLSFVGSYVLANFKFASDGNGGTIVYDPPVTSSAPKVLSLSASRDNFLFASDPGQSPIPQIKPETGIKYADDSVLAKTNAFEAIRDAHGSMADAIHNATTIEIFKAEHPYSHQSDFHLV